MRTKAFILTIMVAAVLSSCSRHETPVTGNYGGRVVSGQVVMASDMTNGSPAGLEVSVVGTGMTATLGADGRFTFVGVPENAEMTFRRADGIDSRLRLSGPTNSLTVEVSANGVKETNSNGGGRRRASSKKDPGPSLQFEGTLVGAATADKLTIHDSHGNDVEITLTDTTLIRKGNETVAATDLKDGDRVHVKALNINGVLIAIQVIVQNPAEDDDDDEAGTTMTANGPVRSVNPLVVFSQPKGEVTVNTDDKTIIRKQGQIITVDDIKVGDEINCLGTRVDDTTMLARQIEVRGNDHDNGGGNGNGNGNGGGNGKGKGGGH